MSFSIYELFGLIIFIYILLPTVLGRCLHLGVFWRGRRTPQVALTFDDGPDPQFTPHQLKTLKEHNVQASFFVVGKLAEQYPDLIRQIAAEGHTLGSHGYQHGFSWLQGPFSSIREISRGNQSITKITGKAPGFYRPSWGVFNLASFLFLRFNKQKVLLWSFMSQDWAPMSTSEKITCCVLKKIKPGSVVVFHDRCTKPGAAEDGPAKMLEALPGILEELKNRGLKPVKLEEMAFQDTPMVKRALRRLWQVWEYGFEKAVGLQPVGNLFRLTVRNYRGKIMQLPDGTLLNPGDKVGELHLNNDLLQSITSTTASIERVAVRVLRETRRSLPLLAQKISQDPDCQGIKALVGVTMIHRGTTQLGFSVYDLSPGIRPVVAWYQRWLLFLLHPGGLAHLRKQWSKLVPKKVIISRQELIKRYLLEEASIKETPILPVEVLPSGNWNHAS